MIHQNPGYFRASTRQAEPAAQRHHYYKIKKGYTQLPRGAAERREREFESTAVTWPRAKRVNWTCALGGMDVMRALSCQSERDEPITSICEFMSEEEGGKLCTHLQFTVHIYCIAP